MVGHILYDDKNSSKRQEYINKKIARKGKNTSIK